MFTRAHAESVVFSHPFELKGVDRVLPAGSYRVVTDEELIPELSFPVYRRVSTSIFVPGESRYASSVEMVAIEPRDLQAALDRDSAMGGLPTAEANAPGSRSSTFERGASIQVRIDKSKKRQSEAGQYHDALRNWEDEGGPVALARTTKKMRRPRDVIGNAVRVMAKRLGKRRRTS